MADLIFEETPASTVVVLDGTGCSSTIPSHSETGDFDIEIQNRTDGTMALVIGTYNDGFGHDDLVAYGRDISTRPDFIEALEIYEVGPQATRRIPDLQPQGRADTGPRPEAFDPLTDTSRNKPISEQIDWYGRYRPSAKGARDRRFRGWSSGNV